MRSSATTTGRASVPAARCCCARRSSYRTRPATRTPRTRCARTCKASRLLRSAPARSPALGKVAKQPESEDGEDQERPAKGALVLNAAGDLAAEDRGENRSGQHGEQRSGRVLPKAHPHGAGDDALHAERWHGHRADGECRHHGVALEEIARPVEFSPEYRAQGL